MPREKDAVFALPSPFGIPIGQLLMAAFSKTPDDGEEPKPETPAKPKTPAKPETPTTVESIPVSELHTLLETERTRSSTATEERLSSRILSEELMKELGIQSVSELAELLAAVDEDDDEGDDEGDDEPEEVVELRNRYESELQQREAEVTERDERNATFLEEIRGERIDNRLIISLNSHQARSPALIAGHLRQFVRLDKNRQPEVIDEKGQPRMRTVEHNREGDRRFETVPMNINDLVDEYLKDPDNAHLLPASNRQGGGGANPTPSGTGSFDERYREARDASEKQGSPTQEFLKLRSERLKAQRV